MLTQTNFFNLIETLLPDYELYQDLGEFTAAARVAGTNTVKHTVNGLFQMSPYNYVASNGLKIVTATARIELMPSPSQMPGVRDTINGLAAVNSNATTIMTEIITPAEGETPAVTQDYTVTSYYSSAYVGQERTAPSNTGEIVPVTMMVTWFIFESGINGNDIKLYIDGKQIYYTELNMPRSRTIDAIPKQSGRSEAKILNTNASISFNAPLLSTDGSAILQSAVYEAETNEAHCIEIKVKTTSYRYIMAFGNCINTSAPGQNAGVQINLHETSPDEVETWGATWGVYPVTGSTAHINIATNTVIFWGDGTTEEIDEYASHTYTDGLTEHTVVTYGSTPLAYRALRVGDILYGKHLKYVGTSIESNEGPITLITASDGSKFGLFDSRFEEQDADGSPTTISDDSYLYHDTEWLSIINTVDYINPSYTDFEVRISEMGL